jgi:hypothetical protein
MTAINGNVSVKITVSPNGITVWSFAMIKVPLIL